MGGKRANGEGTISYVASRKRWVARLTITDEATGRTNRVARTGRTQTEALDKIAEVRKRAEAGAPVSDSKMLVSDYAKRWAETTLLASGLKQKSIDTYGGLARTHVIGGSLGPMPLASLKPAHVERWLLGLHKAGKAGDTVRLCLTALRKILDAAVRDGLVARNAAATVKRPAAPHKEAVWLSDSEVAAVLKAAEGSQFHPVFVLIASTGLRRGEALALRWADVDLDGAPASMRVNGTLARAGGVLTFSSPKSKGSRRTVPLTAALVELLRAQRKRQAAQRLKAGADWQDNGLVFSTDTGGPLDPNNALHAFKAAAVKAGAPDAVIHSLRHSAATGMLTRGVPLHVVSRILGHASVAITGDLYGHVATDDAMAAMEVLGARRLMPTGIPTGTDTQG